MQLVGRDPERRRLKAALADSDIGLVIVRGASGCGKTALVDAVLSDISSDGTIIGRGKYAEGSIASGFAPILQALSEAVGNSLDLLYDPAAGAESLRVLLSGQLAVLEAAGFSGLGVLPVSGSMVEAAPGRRQEVGIIDSISRLMRWLDGFGVPVVLFVDDWHRAPQEAHPITAIASRNQAQRLCTIVLAERSEALAPQGCGQPHVELIELGPLSPLDQIALLGAAAGDRDVGCAIAEWLGSSTTGLPFDLLEAARAVLQGSVLERKNGIWSLDPARAASIDRRDFVDTVVRRLRALPSDILAIGVAFALLGDRTSLMLVAEALERPLREIVEAAQSLRHEGIIQVADDEISFVHDRLRAGLLAAPEGSMRQALAAQMAQRILALRAPRQLLRVALQLRLVAGLEDAAPATWRDRFAVGAGNARNEADATAATTFAEAAWTLRERERPADRASDALILREAALAAAARHDLEGLRIRVEEMIGQARSREQIGEAYELGIVAAALAGDHDLAWTWTVDGSRWFGARLPAKARASDLFWSVIRWHIGAFLHRRSRTRHVVTVDPLSRIVNVGAVIAYGRDPRLMLLMRLRMMTRAYRFGYRSAFWTGTECFLCAALGNLERASELGAMAADGAAGLSFARAATLYRALYFGLIWTRPLATLRDGCLTIYDIAIAEGDSFYAALAVRNGAMLAWRTAPTLAGLAVFMTEAEDKAVRLHDAGAQAGLRAYVDTVRALRDPRGFDDPADRGPWTSRAASPGAEAPIVWIEILGMRGDWTGVLTLARRFEAVGPALNAHPGGVIWCFHDNLARLKLGLAPRRRDLRYIRKAARLNPADHRHKLLILEAEMLRRKGGEAGCLATYARAVEMATAGTSRLEAGLAAECAAAAARSFGRIELSTGYDALARGIWMAWGALARIGTVAASDGGASADFRARLVEAESKAATALRSERAKSRFLAEVGHELRTPLQGMQGLLDLAAETPSEVGFDEVREVFSNLKSIVDDLSDLGAMGGGAPLNLKPASIAAVIESEARVAAVMAQRKSLAFVLEAGDDGVIVNIDTGRVRQVVRNLLSNAVKYTDRGEVRLRLVIESGTADRSPGIAIIVEDTGPGLRDIDLARLFEPFERGDRIDDPGLGLGLALSRRIADRMGGTLTAANRQEGGSVFTFAFTADRASEQPKAAIATTPLRILLVEDVPLSRRVIAAMLARDGHAVSQAADGAEALALFDRHVFDLMLLDLGLPDIDGIEVLDRVRRSRRGAKLPVIVLTASIAGTVAERARKSGAARVLHKPVSREDLREALGSFFAIGDDIADDPGESAELADQLRQLKREAQAEILVRGRALAAQAGASTAADVHRLAGLAAQFGAGEVAAAADHLEADMAAGTDISVGAALLQAALTRLAARTAR